MSIKFEMENLQSMLFALKVYDDGNFFLHLWFGRNIGTWRREVTAAVLDWCAERKMSIIITRKILPRVLDSVRG